MIDDAELLRRYARDHSEEAFAEIVRRHLRGVYSAALRRVGGDAHLAEDAAQKVFIALAQKAEPVARHPHLTSWLYTATRHEAAKLVRTEQRRRAREQKAHTMHENDPSPAADADWSRVSPALDGAIDQLNESDRRVVLLRFIDRRSFAEIGAALRISEDAARMRSERALDKVRSLLQRRGIASTAGALGLALAENAAGAVPHGLEPAITGAALASGSAPVATAGIATVLAGVLLSPATGALLLLAAALGAARYEWAREQTAEQNLATTQIQYQLLSASLQADAQSLAGLRQKAGALRAAAAAPAKAEADDPKAAGAAFLARHPEVKQALEAWIDAGTHARFGALYQALALTPDQIQQLEVLLRPGHSLSKALSSEAVTLSLDGDLTPPERQNQIRQLLGDDGYRQFLRFNRATPARTVASDLASLLVATDSPLSTSQAQQVADIFTGAAQPREAAQFDWDSALSAAQGVLSPAQFSQLQNLQAQHQSLEELQSGGP